MAEIQSQREIVEKKIRKACAKEFRSLGELSEILTMNKHTLRAHYLYPMVRSGQLVRKPLPPAKNTVKYKSAGSNN
jgi:hypothetical protein